jgi:RNA polymerase sigma-54 factor
MSLLSPRLQLKVAQKQILTPGLVQMVTVLQLNRLELKEMITQEIVKNPVLEEATEEPGEEITPEELLPLLEQERVADPADKQILESAVMNEGAAIDGAPVSEAINGNLFADAEETAAVVAEAETAVIDPLETPASPDPFDEIDFGSFFDDYLDPGYKSPASESVEKPSFETFLSAPLTLGDHLRSQLSVSLVSDEIRDAAECIIGNLDEDGYVSASLDEIAAASGHTAEQVEEALKVVQSLDPAGVAARNLRECLLLQIESMNGKGGVAWQIVSSHLRLLETRQFKELVKVLGRPADHIDTAVAVIQHLNPRPGLRYSSAGARVVEPDVYFIRMATSTSSR